MANWKIVLDDVKMAFYALILIAAVISVSTLWFGIVIAIVPVAFIVGWIEARKKR